jgi:CubicO group peptidase (beta-lactamase class C family)
MRKSKNILLFTVLFISVTAFCQVQLSDTKSEEISAFIEQAIKDLEIPGGAVAIIKNNEVIYKNYFGKGNLEYNIPVTNSSLFRLHSLSKIFVSVAVFQLIEQNKISLEDKISKYLKDLPDSWKAIKIKNLLSHSSGLPDMREETDPSEEIALKNVYGKEIQFPIGERARYNQTNFWLLNRIIREISGNSFQNYISNQFENESNVCFSNISDIIPNRVMEYKPGNIGRLKNYHFLVQDYMYGAGGITMTLDHLIDWDKKLNKNTLINEISKNEMFTKFKYKIGTGFSYGWDVQSLNGIVSYGFNGGGLVNYRKFPSKNISIIWFTNGYRRPHNIDNITNRIVGFVDKDLLDKTPESAKLLQELFSSNKSKKIIRGYHKIKKKYPYVNFENVLNSLGYNFLSKKKIEKAIIVFKINTEEFPKSANTYDSLGESYFMNKQYDLSLINYKKVVELDNSNENAKIMIEKIKNISN